MADGLPNIILQLSNIPQSDRAILTATEQRVGVVPAERNAHDWFLMCLEALNDFLFIKDPNIAIFIGSNNASWV